MLRKLYQKLPLPHNIRLFLSSKIPYKFKRQNHLKSFGVINDLYPWRTDLDIDTIAPIQNFYSPLFPDDDTSTVGHVWFFDANGNLLKEHDFSIPSFGFHQLRLSDFVPNNASGTFMWHLQMPETVAKNPEVLNGSIYFTDRGYICFEKSNTQPAFVHGIDRYSVFQKRDKTSFNPFYPSSVNRTWTAEFPLIQGMQKRIEIILINRSDKPRKLNLSVKKNGGGIYRKEELVIQSRGLGVFNIEDESLLGLDGEFAYFTIDGIPTPWGRPAIMRHFESGALSVMHC